MRDGRGSALGSGTRALSERQTLLQRRTRPEERRLRSFERSLAAAPFGTIPLEQPLSSILLGPFITPILCLNILIHGKQMDHSVGKTVENLAIHIGIGLEKLGQ